MPGNLFSHRKGLTPIPSVMITDTITQEVINAIGTCYDVLCNNFKYQQHNSYTKTFCQEDIERQLWIHFENRRLSEFCDCGRYYLVFNEVLQNPAPWHKVLDMVEFVIKYMESYAIKSQDRLVIKGLQEFETNINNEFQRLNYGYRVVNHQIVDITSEQEREAIETAVLNSKDNVREHLNKALEHYSQKPEPDIRNSIKESITAVETVCREYTGLVGDNGTLGKALGKLEDNGIVLHSALKRGFEQLYTYTNSAETGIRHALMDPEGRYVPSKDEAYLMLVQCCTFINYLRMKYSQIKK